MRLLYVMASLKITLVGMLLLAVGSMLTYGGDTGVSVWVLVVPMVLMAINLICAIATNRKINRQPGLLLFHLSLLALVVVIAVGRMVHLDAQLEMVVGQHFDASNLVKIQQGPWHVGNIDIVNFVQGPYVVNYEPGIQRGATASRVGVISNDGTVEEEIVGDDTPLIFGDYRLYTSFNKGFAVILEWLPNDGQSQQGSINMPSYPLNDYQQKNEWIPPGSDHVIKFWLKLETALDENEHWLLSEDTSSGVLVVTVGDQRVELEEGGELKFADGRLRYSDLTMWMGYTIFYDPTLRWIFFISVFGVLALGWHFWQHAERLLDASVKREKTQKEGVDSGS